MTTTRLTERQYPDLSVHSALPRLLEATVAEVLGAAHVAHGDREYGLWRADASWTLQPDRPL